MEGIVPGKRVLDTLEKYKYGFLVAVAGILLMLLPGGSVEQEQPSTEPELRQETLEQTLEAVLSQIQGAGRVKVLLSQRTGEEILYQTDTDEDTDGEGTSRQSRTVVVSDDSRKENGLVRRTDPPQYLGAVVVCEGADNAQVCLAVVEAVSCATGLDTSRISVLKMK